MDLVVDWVYCSQPLWVLPQKIPRDLTVAVPWPLWENSRELRFGSWVGVDLWDDGKTHTVIDRRSPPSIPQATDGKSSESHPLMSKTKSTPRPPAPQPMVTVPSPSHEPSPVAEVPAAPEPGADSPASLVPATTEIMPRPPLNLQPTRRGSLKVAGNRPIDPSPIQVSYTVSLAGTRPVGSNENPGSAGVDFKHTPYVMNRPVAPNQTEDSTKMLEYLD